MKPHSPLNSGSTFLANLRADLMHQAMDAVMGHAQSKQVPSDKQLANIVDFELGLYTAQVWDRSADRLDRDGATGGASKLSGQYYYPGINDVLGGIGRPRLRSRHHDDVRRLGAQTAAGLQ